MEEYKVKTTCRICNNKELIRVADFGDVPLANALVKKGFNGVTKYPVSINFCPICSLTQLGVVVNPKILYKDYRYHSSISEVFKKHCMELGMSIKELMTVKNPFAVDIASNDGCLLEQFRDIGFEVLGVEPAENLVTISRNKNIETISKFWSSKIKLPHKADCITATNVFAHVDDLKDFVSGVALNLVDGGIFVIEVPWFLNLVNKNQFDTIYHEHLSYFLLKPIIEILHNNKLDVFRAEEVDIHGGSLRVYATNNKKSHQKESSVNEIVDIEANCKLYFSHTYTRFSNNVDNAISSLNKMIGDLSHKKIAGYCASAKGISLLNYCGVTVKSIKMIADETPAKQGMIIPNAKIPIVSMEELKKFNPDYLILFSWNFIDELKKKTSWFKGRYIIPIPYARVE